MKNKFTLLSILAAAMVFAQQDDPYRGRVGINTTTPNATLEVAGKPAEPSVVDGIIIPKISGDELKAKNNIYGEAQKGTVVYVTSVPTSQNEIDFKTNNIREEGTYFFDGKIWRSYIQHFVPFAGGYTTRYKIENGDKYKTFNDLYCIDLSFSNKSDKKYGTEGEGAFVTGLNNYGVDKTVVFGEENIGKNSFSTVFGKSNKANGQYSTVFGNNNTTSGQYSTVFGNNNTTKTPYNFISGSDNTSNSWYGALIGRKLTSHSPLSVIIGQYNKEETNYDWNNIWQKSELFVLANGLSKASEGHNAFTMWFSGLFKWGMYDINNKKNAMVNEGFIMEKGIHGADLDGKLNTWNGEQWEKYVTMTFSTTAPLSPKQGDLYFNTTDKKYYAYDGTDWQPMW